MKKNNQYKFNKKQTKLYLISFGAFFLIFMGILISPFVFGKTYTYAEAVENEYQTINNTIKMALVKKEYNPEKELFRLDFSVEESSQTTSLPNVQYEVQSRYVENQKDVLETEIKKVNDNYFILFIEGVPEDFEVLSTTIIPSYIHPELQTTNDLEGKGIKVYINESQNILNNDLLVKEDSFYQKEYLSFKQEELEKEIQSKGEEIDKNNLAIVEIKRLISSLEEDLDYQTQEEKFETHNTIQKHKTTIVKHENKIEEIKKEIEEYNNRIKNLEERKNKN